MRCHACTHTDRQRKVEQYSVWAESATGKAIAYFLEEHVIIVLTENIPVHTNHRGSLCTK